MWLPRPHHIHPHVASVYIHPDTNSKCALQNYAPCVNVFMWLKIVPHFLFTKPRFGWWINHMELRTLRKHDCNMIMSLVGMNGAQSPSVYELNTVSLFGQKHLLNTLNCKSTLFTKKSRQLQRFLCLFAGSLLYHWSRAVLIFQHIPVCKMINSKSA